MGGGFFGSIFDFNNDGELDAYEQAVEMYAFSQFMKSRQKNEEDEDDNN